MNKLPTPLARQMLERFFSLRCTREVEVCDAIATFQRFSLTSDFEACWQATSMWFKPESRKLASDSPERQALMAVHAMSKNDILGHAIENLYSIVTSKTGSTKEKIAASTIVNELFGEKKIADSKGLAERLIMNFPSRR